MTIPENYTKKINDLPEKDKSFILNYLEKNYTSEIFYNQEIMIVMKKIFLDMSYIYEALEILENSGMKLKLSLVGGALRDLFTGKFNSIKDLDIVLSIEDARDISTNQYVDIVKHIEKSEKLKELVDINKKKYEHWEDFNIDKKIATLVESALARKLNIKQTFLPLDLPQGMKDNGLLRSNYHNLYLRGVVKLEDRNLKYPIDILICNSYAQDYVETFDFNICKIMLSITSKQFKSMLLNFNWDTLETIKNQIIPFNEFWIDLTYKRLTLNPIGFDIDALERAIVDHLPRLQAKYPDYELKLADYNDEDLLDEDVKDYLRKMDQFIHLSEKLPTKEDSKKLKPLKI